jgi:adenine nucleotide transporter 17
MPPPQYTVFEQLKNILVARRTARLRAAGGTAKAIAVLSDMDYLWLGAISKLGMSCICRKIWHIN